MKTATFGKVRRDKAGRLIWTPSRKAYAIITRCAKLEAATYQATGNKILNEVLRQGLKKIAGSKDRQTPRRGDYGQLIQAVLRFRMSMEKGGAK